jgi:death-on-curing protein
MARSNRRVYQIAEMAGCEVPEALGILRRIGIPVEDGSDLVPKERRLEALAAVQAEMANRATAARSLLEREERAASSLLEREERKARKRRHRRAGYLDSEVSYLNAKDVIDVHWTLVSEFANGRDPIEPPGLRDENLLESALHRVHTSLGYENRYPTVPTAAAAYLHAMNSNHAFHTGNKRTALVATLVFLDLNGFVPVAEEDDLYDYLRQISDHKLIESESGKDVADSEITEIAQWIHNNAHKISNEERILKFHELRGVLSNYGCKFEKATRGNRINISRGEDHTQLSYRNEDTIVQWNTIGKIRKDLHLMDEDGYDSTIFYNKDQKILGFIRKYRRTLDRLAKV